MDSVSALRASALFEGFTDTGIRILSAIAVPKTFPAGAPVFVENMLSDSMWIIAKGTVSLSTKSNSAEVHLGDLGPGDWLGELSLISSGQRACSGTAKGQVLAFEIRQAEFQKLMSTKPQACIKLMMSICSHLGKKVAANKEALKSLAKG
jgi:CRP/FNR family transcriptional regulator, cyclic AMP receptor protein